MATPSKTARASSGKKVTQAAPQCPNGGPDEVLVRTLFAGFGKHGFYWVCSKGCGYEARHLTK